MILEDYYKVYSAAHGSKDFTKARERLKAAAAEVPSMGHSQIQWMTAALLDPHDEGKKHFVAYLLHEATYFPEQLMAPMLNAAIEELNPNMSRGYVEPCVKAFSAKKVLEALLPRMRSPDPFEVSGAIHAIHWALADSGKGGGEESLHLVDVKHKLNRELLDIFLKNPDLDVQRVTVSLLDVNPESYPEEMRPQLQKAVKMARGHGDQFVRHRIEVQYGREPAHYALPPRQPRGKLHREEKKKSWWSEFWK